MRHSKPPTSSEYSGLDSAPFSLPPHKMHAKSHARSHALTYRHTHNTHKQIHNSKQAKEGVSSSC